jgi:ribosome biogenesis GTPase / thiamine phosphate phosphatase
MTIEDLGYTKEIQKYILYNNLSEFSVGRVTQEHRESYIVSVGSMEYNAEVTGNLRFSATGRADFPAVGDWVAMQTYDSDQAIIHKLLPRKSLLERQSVSKPGEKQIISANIDVALIVQSIDNNFNINRLERYVTICNSANIEPVLVISKLDLSTGDELKEALAKLNTREKRIRYILLSNVTMQGLQQVKDLLEKGKTYCVIGSSGVGKSTLINNLLQDERLKTGTISVSTMKGKHVSSSRELFVLDNGGIIIDTPGMRELGITEDADALNSTFEDIFNLTLQCKFTDCTHSNEAGCAVLDAIDAGAISVESFENYKKMKREQERFTTSIAEKRKKDKKFGKMAKAIMQEKKKNKF